jgi:hypothetical protein
VAGGHEELTRDIARRVTRLDNREFARRCMKAGAELQLHGHDELLRSKAASLVEA